LYLNNLTEKLKSFSHLRNISEKYIFITLIVFVYGKTIGFNFVWDDYVLYRDFIEKSIPSLLFEKQDSIFSVHYYPLLLLSHKIDFFFSKFIFIDQIDKSHFTFAIIPHATNIFIYFIATIFFYKLSNLFFNNQTIAFISTLVFILHPIHVNSVAWISGRTDLLATTFCIISLNFYLQFLSNQNYKSFFLTLLFYFCAIFSKIVAINFIFAYALLFLYFRNLNRIHINKKIITFFSSIVLINFLYLYTLFNFSFLDQAISLKTNQEINLKQIYNLFQLVIFYFEKGFFPLAHNILSIDLMDNDYFYLKLTIFFMIVGFSIYRYYIFRDKIFLILLTLFFLTLVTAYYSYLKSLDNTDMFNISAIAERYVFLPSIFSSLFLGYALSLFKNKFKIIIPIFIIVFFTTSFLRVEAYRNNLSFANYTPDKNRTTAHYIFLQQVLMENNNLPQAKKVIERGMKKFPNYEKFYLVLSNIENKMGNTVAAEMNRQKALDLNKKDPLFNLRAGQFFLKQKQYLDAKFFFKSSIGLTDDKILISEALSLMGFAEFKLNNLDSSVEILLNSIDLNPMNAQSYFYLGKVFIAKKNKDKASEFFLKAIELDPSFLEKIK